MKWKSYWIKTSFRRLVEKPLYTWKKTKVTCWESWRTAQSLSWGSWCLTYSQYLQTYCLLCQAIHHLIFLVITRREGSIWFSSINQWTNPFSSRVKWFIKGYAGGRIQINGLHSPFINRGDPFLGIEWHYNTVFIV